jgi:imidazolonepropionase
VTATRNSSSEALYQIAQARLARMMREGVTTLEIKSGYGLDDETEEKLLRVAQRLAQEHAIEISPTLLAAHAVPQEYRQDPDGWIDHICQHMLPALWQKQLFEAVDVFCESVGFTPAQSERLFQAAKRLGIPVKGHVEQLSNLGGTALVSRYHGWSADHIEYLDEAGVAAMAQSGTVAVLLPGAFYFLQERQRPPVGLLRQQGVPIAVATDFNPGTSPFASLHLAMNMACVQFGLTPEEAWAGETRCQLLSGEFRQGGDVRLGAAKAIAGAHHFTYIKPLGLNLTFTQDFNKQQGGHQLTVAHQLVGKRGRGRQRGGFCQGGDIFKQAFNFLANHVRILHTLKDIELNFAQGIEFNEAFSRLQSF